MPSSIPRPARSIGNDDRPRLGQACGPAASATGVADRRLLGRGDLAGRLVGEQSDQFVNELAERSPMAS